MQDVQMTEIVDGIIVPQMMNGKFRLLAIMIISRKISYEQT